MLRSRIKPLKEVTSRFLEDIPSANETPGEPGIWSVEINCFLNAPHDLSWDQEICIRVHSIVLLRTIRWFANTWIKHSPTILKKIQSYRYGYVPFEAWIDEGFLETEANFYYKTFCLKSWTGGRPTRLSTSNRFLLEVANGGLCNWSSVGIYLLLKKRNFWLCANSFCAYLRLSLKFILLFLRSNEGGFWNC